jgi:hypothetical protein
VISYTTHIRESAAVYWDLFDRPPKGVCYFSSVSCQGRENIEQKFPRERER